jgi:hypothetical protein
MAWVVIATSLSLGLFWYLRRPTLADYRQRYQRALQILSQYPQDPELKQIALRLGRAYYLQRAGRQVSLERQYSIEAALSLEVERAIVPLKQPP